MKNKVIGVCFLCCLVCSCNNNDLSDTISSIDENMASSCAETNDNNIDTDNSDDQSDDIMNLSKLVEDNPDITVLTWYYNDLVEISDEVEYEINSYFLNNDTSYFIDFVRISETAFERTINNKINTGNAPDIISASMGSTDNGYTGTYRAIKNEWFYELDDYLHSEQGKDLYDCVPEKCWNASKVYGKVYGVSTSLPYVTDFAYYINEDILKEYNLDISDFEGKFPWEIDDILDKIDNTTFTMIDFDSSDKVLLPRLIGVEQVVDVRGNQSEFFAVECGKNSADYLLNIETARKQLLKIHEYHEKGYLDKKNNFFISISGINRLDYTMEEMTIEQLKMKYPEAGNIKVACFKYAPITTNFNSITGICKASNNRELALEAFKTVMNNQTINNLLLYGVVGVDYIINPEGKIDDDGFSRIYSIYFGNKFVATTTKNEPDDLKIIYNELPEADLLGIYIDLGEYKDDIIKINDVFNEYVEKLATGEYSSLDDIIIEITNEVDKYNCKDIVNEINSQIIK